MSTKTKTGTHNQTQYEAFIIPPSEYDSLVPDEGNRNVSRSRVRNLKESLKSIGQTTPLIIVPSNKEGTYRVISGHHRRVALMELGMPIKVIVDLDFENMSRVDLTEVMIAGTKSKNWSAGDAMERLATWNSSYRWVKDLVESGPLYVSFLYQRLLFPDKGGGTENEKDLFIEGQFELTPEIREEVVNFNNLVKDTLELRNRSWSLNSLNVNGCKALHNVYKMEGFDSDRWLNAVERDGLVRHSRIDEWEEDFLSIYNKHLSTKNRLNPNNG